MLSCRMPRELYYRSCVWSSKDALIDWLTLVLCRNSTIAQQAREMGAKQIPAIIELTRLGLASQQEGLAAIDRLFTIAKPLKKHRIFSTIRQVFPPPIGSHSFALSRTATSSSLFPPRFAAQYPLRILCAEDNPVKYVDYAALLSRMRVITPCCLPNLTCLLSLFYQSEGYRFSIESPWLQLDRPCTRWSGGC